MHCHEMERIIYKVTMCSIHTASKVFIIKVCLCQFLIKNRYKSTFGSRGQLELCCFGIFACFPNIPPNVKDQN